MRVRIKTGSYIGREGFAYSTDSPTIKEVRLLKDRSGKYKEITIKESEENLIKL